ncbi:sensor histidine kinase [Paenibacillus tyrfis]|uniref:histidine kinase n=1 Tax=Paenibacillus tyrfis TaxID=1501230 RepID=A0A081NYR2_9BACL|nr:HAMP domain-containing sensor histidine kinase [Paenibacillus tyrfis]KEQ23585.1 histidine kinase [Paenibacillus tyrfis]
MNRISRRLTFQFVAQLVLFIVVMALGALVLLVYVGLQTEKHAGPDSEGIRGLGAFRSSFTVKGGQAVVDAAWASALPERGGWLQVVSPEGRVLASSAAPADVPGQYAPGELFAYWKKKLPFPYALTVNRVEKDDKTYVVVYGEKRKAEQALQQALPAFGGRALSPAGEQALRQQQASLYIYDADGRLLHAFGESHALRPEASLGDMLGNAANARKTEAEEAVYFDPATRQTWIVRTSDGMAAEAGEGFDRMISNAFLTYFIGLAAFILLLSYVYGVRFGRPFRVMLEFIEQLASGNYAQPPRTGKEKSGDSRNRLRKPKGTFRLFREVNESLEGLRLELARSEQLRNRLEQTREEWITGVSHDLKTPLSSISGYAHVLESAPYSWSGEELQTIGRTLREKSDFMSELIEDLSLTYRLKNNALPLDRKPSDVNEVVRRAVVAFMNDPQAASYAITFSPSSSPITYPIDRKWFTRIVDNMISNAIKHNPAQTAIDIAVKDEPGRGFSVTIRDNGAGMDPKTLDRLFDRYYRGTNTEETTSGSGLGMTIAKQLTLAHGGEITVRSEPGEGTEIVLRFGGA